jgi:hypothetical protein
MLDVSWCCCPLLRHPVRCSNPLVWVARLEVDLLDHQLRLLDEDLYLLLQLSLHWLLYRNVVLDNCRVVH